MSKKKVMVAGDLTMDCMLARIQVSERSGAVWEHNYETHAYSELLGGAALIADILRALDPNEAKYKVESAWQPATTVKSKSYTLLKQYKDGDKTVWRVEQFIGFDQKRERGVYPKQLAYHPCDLLILDEGNQGFANGRQPRPSNSAWALLKWARPVFHPAGKVSKLWRYASKNFRGRLILVLMIDDLRLTGMEISQQLSWERTAQDIVREVTGRPLFQCCAHVIVSLYTAGAVVCSQNSGWKSTLIYDPEKMEREWWPNDGSKMFGYTQCLVSAIAYHFLASVKPGERNIIAAVQRGIAASRGLHRAGFEISNIDDKEQFPGKLEFPAQGIARDIADGEKTEDCKDIAILPKSGWAILEELFPFRTSAENAATAIIKNGTGKTLMKAPSGRFGDLFTVDRTEIESLRTIAGLITEYKDISTHQRPLCMAVFGSPGSGKSFGITELTKSLGEKDFTKKTFNLSQFTNADDLFGALHQVRDDALSGALPLVFWDEFDAPLGDRELGWLSYFLAPMQDGKFQQGEVTHAVGRAIFVFAGGSSFTMANFSKRLEQPDAKKMKLPDFLSRLKGFMDVPSLDHHGGSGAQVIIRRALLLRSVLIRYARHLVHKNIAKNIAVDEIIVDDGVRRAFLLTTKFKYGARSMESIVYMSRLAGKSSYERSSLPPKEQLDLHVNADEFLAYVRKPPLN